MNKSIDLRVIAVILAVLISGCASTKFWQKDGASNSDLRGDSYQFEKDARQSNFGGGLLGGKLRQEFCDRCMESRGWTLSESGTT
jgi:hypothetical protein